MPQLDVYMISSQIFWLLIKFNVMYVLLLETYIINFSSLFKARYKVVVLAEPRNYTPANLLQMILD